MKEKTEVKFGPSNLDDHYTCYYCGLASKQVEAGGVWYCPNFGCSGPGGCSHRRQLKSYVEVSGGKHSVDLQEWRDECLERARRIEDRYIRKAMEHSAKQMLTKITSTKFGL